MEQPIMYPVGTILYGSYFSKYSTNTSFMFKVTKHTKKSNLRLERIDTSQKDFILPEVRLATWNSYGFEGWSCGNKMGRVILRAER